MLGTMRQKDKMNHLFRTYVKEFLVIFNEEEEEQQQQQEQERKTGTGSAKKRKFYHGDNGRRFQVTRTLS